MKLAKRLLVSSFIALSVFVLPVFNGIALSAEPQPTTLTINQIDAFNNVINDNDQLHIITFEIDNTSSNYTASQSYIFRFYSNGVEIATTVPYAFYDEGRSQGVVGFFFDADDTDLPTWESDNLTISIIGNPTIDWDTDIPSDNNSSWNGWSESVLVAARIRIIAQQLEDLWSVDLIEPVSGVNKLTSYGEDYFESAIPNLRRIAPALFSSSTTQPSFPTDNHSTTAGNTMIERLTVTGNTTLTSENTTIFDPSPLEESTGLSSEWILSMIWITGSIVVLVSMSYGTSKVTGEGITTRTVRPSLYIFGFMLIVGSFMGFMVPQAGLFCGVIGGIILVFAILWKDSP